MILLHVARPAAIERLPPGFRPDVAMSERRRLSEGFLELLAGRVDDARATLEAVGELRRTIDRYDGFGRRWHSYQSRPVNTSSLKLKLVGEFEAASSAARKLGGQKLVRLANDLDDARTLVLPIIDPPNDAGIRGEEARHIWQLLRISRTRRPPR